MNTNMRCSKCGLSLYGLSWWVDLSDGNLCPRCVLAELKDLRAAAALLPRTADDKLISVGEWYFYLTRDGPEDAKIWKTWRQTGYDYWLCETARREVIPAHDLYAFEDAAWEAWNNCNLGKVWD